MAVGFYGLYVNYENKTGILAALFGIVSMITNTIVLGLLPAVYGASTTGFELLQTDLFSLLFLVLFSSFVSLISSLTAGISLYQVKDVIGNRDLAIVAAGFFLFSAVLVWIVIIVAYLLLAILFLQAKIPETDEWLKKPKSEFNW